MAFDIQIGDGRVATIHEPSRGMFPSSLGGAVEYSLAHAIYKVMEVMGASLGSFVGGLAVQFMERIEPHLVDYARPLLDILLEAPGLDPHLRDFLNKLRNPEHEAASAILTGLAGSAGGSVINSVLGVLTWPVTAWLNNRIKPSRPSPGDAWAMYYRGLIDQNTRTDWLNDTGWFPAAQTAYGELARPRADVGTMATAVVQSKMTEANYLAETRKRGITDTDAQLFLQVSRRYLAVGDLMASMLRGDITASKVQTDLQAQGFSAADVQSLIKLSQQIPNVSDLIRMSVREAFSEDVSRAFGHDADFPGEVVDWAAKQGLSADWVRRYWRAHWELPSPQMGYEMMHRGVIDLDTMRTLLRTADYAPFWRDKLIAIAYAPYTRVDARRMYGLGVLTREQVKRAYLDLGYDNDKAEHLTEFTVRYEDENGLSKKEEYRKLTQAAIISAYKKGIFNRQETMDSLLALRYEPEDAEVLLDIADAEKAVARKPDWQPEYLRDMISIVENAYIRSIIDPATARGLFADLDLGEAEIQYRMNSLDHAKVTKDQDAMLKLIGDAYTGNSITRIDAVTLIGQQGIPAAQQDTLFDEWDRVRGLRTRKLTEAQYTHLWELGLIADEEYLQNLRGLGFAEYDLKLLYTLRRAQKDSATAKAQEPRALTVTQYSQALRDGLMTRDAYIAALLALGYSRADIDILIYFATRTES